MKHLSIVLGQWHEIFSVKKRVEKVLTCITTNVVGHLSSSNTLRTHDMTAWKIDTSYSIVRITSNVFVTLGVEWACAVCANI